MARLLDVLLFGKFLSIRRVSPSCIGNDVSAATLGEEPPTRLASRETLMVPTKYVHTPHFFQHSWLRGTRSNSGQLVGPPSDNSEILYCPDDPDQHRGSQV